MAGEDITREFRIEDERSPLGGVVVAVYGDLDQYVAPELRDRLVAAVDGGTSPLVVDLSAATFIDSMTLGVLLGAHKRARTRGGDLRLVIPESEIRRIFEITLLDRIFVIARTREEAFAFSSGDGDDQRSGA